MLCGIPELLSYGRPLGGELVTARAEGVDISLYSSDYHFRDIYMLTSAAEDEEYVPERAVAGLTGWIDCFEKARLTGTVFAGGVSAPGETEGHPSLVRAYEMGKAIKG